MKDKEIILKVSRKKWQLTYKKMRKSGFSLASAELEASEQDSICLKVLKKGYFPPRGLYSTKDTYRYAMNYQLYLSFVFCRQWFDDIFQQNQGVNQYLRDEIIQERVNLF